MNFKYDDKGFSSVEDLTSYVEENVFAIYNKLYPEICNDEFALHWFFFEWNDNINKLRAMKTGDELKCFGDVVYCVNDEKSLIVPSDDEDKQINAGIADDPDTYESSSDEFKQLKNRNR